MFRSIISILTLVLGLVVLIPLIVAGYLWWDGSQLLGRKEAQAWLAPKPAAADMTTFEAVAAQSLFGDTWNETGIPCRTGARFVLNYVTGADKRGLSISQVVARDIATRVAPGLNVHEQLQQLSMACQLEGQFDDAALLRVWLRYAWFGPGLEGADAAANAVFGKAASLLDAQQSAKLVALVRWPDSRDNSDAWQRRTQLIASRSTP